MDETNSASGDDLQSAATVPILPPPVPAPAPGRTPRANWRHILAFLLVLALIAFIIAAGPADAQGHAPDNVSARYEINLMRAMIDHEAIAVALGKLCADKAGHPEMQRYCQQIVAGESASMGKLQGWLHDWYQDDYQPQALAGMEGLTRLDAHDFELHLTRILLQHRAADVVAGMECANYAYHAELIDLCRSIVDSHGAEISQLHRWQCDWFGLCSNFTYQIWSA